MKCFPGRALFIVYLVTLIFGLVFGYNKNVLSFVKEHGQKQQYLDNVQQPFYVVKPGFKQVTFIGYTRPRQVMDIIGEESGRCMQVMADIGQEIGHDVIFARLDTTFIDLELKKISFDIKQLQNDLDYLNREVNRYLVLAKKDLFAQAKLEEIENRRDQVCYKLGSLKVQKNILEERRKRFIIRVPPGWIIIQRSLQPGEWVAAGPQKILGRAGDFSSLLVPFALTSEEYTWVKEHSEKLSLLFLDFPGKIRVKAWLDKTYPDFDPETRKFKVDLAVNPDLLEKRGGLKAELTMQLAAPDTLLVPKNALFERYEEHWARIVSGTDVQVMILGSSEIDGQEVWRIKSKDLKPGDKILISPLQ